MAADILAEPAPAQPGFVLTGTAGVAGFWLPDYDTGLLGDANSDDPLTGFTIGISGTIPMGAYGLNPYGGWDGIVGYNFFGAFADDDSVSSSYVYDGDGTVVISGVHAPHGDSSIVLDTSTGGAASVVLTPPTGGSPSEASVSGGGTQAAATVVPGSGGFLLGAVAVDGSGETAFGAIADKGGGVFVATGDLTGLEVTTETSRSLFYTGADLTFGLGSSVNGGTAFSAYVGPSYRGLFQTRQTDVSLYLPSTSPDIGVTFPDFEMNGEENLDSHYFGGIIGGTAAFGLSQGLILSLSGEGGIYGVHASLNGHETYSSGGGVFDDPYDGINQPIYQDDISVRSHDFDLGSDDNVAFSAKGSAALTWAFNPGYALSLGGSVEYLSQVATVDSAQRIFDTEYDSTTTWEPGSGASAQRDIGWGSMVNYAITASLTGSF